MLSMSLEDKMEYTMHIQGAVKAENQCIMS